MAVVLRGARLHFLLPVLFALRLFGGGPQCIPFFVFLELVCGLAYSRRCPSWWHLLLLYAAHALGATLTIVGVAHHPDISFAWGGIMLLVEAVIQATVLASYAADRLLLDAATGRPGLFAFPTTFTGVQAFLVYVSPGGSWGVDGYCLAQNNAAVLALLSIGGLPTLHFLVSFFAAAAEPLIFTRQQPQPLQPLGAVATQSCPSSGVTGHSPHAHTPSAAGWAPFGPLPGAAAAAGLPPGALYRSSSPDGGTQSRRESVSFPAGCRAAPAEWPLHRPPGPAPAAAAPAAAAAAAGSYSVAVLPRATHLCLIFLAAAAFATGSLYSRSTEVGASADTRTGVTFSCIAVRNDPGLQPCERLLGLTQDEAHNNAEVILWSERPCVVSKSDEFTLWQATVNATNGTGAYVALAYDLGALGGSSTSEMVLVVPSGSAMLPTQRVHRSPFGKGPGSSGPSQRSLQTPRLGRVAVMMGFDLSFPPYVRDVIQEASLLLAPAEDYGPLYAMQWNQGALRAAEQGMTVVQCSSMYGLTIVDAQGRTLHDSSFPSKETVAVLRASVPLRTRRIKTLYSAMRDTLGWVCLSAAVIALIIQRLPGGLRAAGHDAEQWVLDHAPAPVLSGWAVVSGCMRSLRGGGEASEPLVGPQQEAVQLTAAHGAPPPRHPRSSSAAGGPQPCWGHEGGGYALPPHHLQYQYQRAALRGADGDCSTSSLGSASPAPPHDLDRTH